MPTAAGGWTDAELSDRAERHRRELHVHCYRMLGSFDDAEDGGQETRLQAGRRQDDLQQPEHLRAWLYKIATHRCLDHLRASRRRVAAVGSPRDVPWLQPYPDRLLTEAAPAEGEPPEALAAQETIALAFVAVLQLLPARQRAVLVLRDVLDWPASQVGGLLELSVPAVNSALQRGRATLRAALPADRRDDWSSGDRAAVDQEVLSRYIAAYENGDVDATLDLLAEDIQVTMPPAPYLFSGRTAIRELAERARRTGAWRLLPTRANGQPAAACYLRAPGGDTYRAYKIDVLEPVADGTLRAITTFGVRHFPAFALPEVLP